MSFNLSGLVRPTLTDVNGDGKIDYADAAGRYVLAEFVAYDDGGPISFVASQGNGTVMQEAAMRTISRHGADGFAEVYRDPENSIDPLGMGKYIPDGSEVVALAEGFYMNERNYDDAVGAEDALGALRISRDIAVSAATSNYSQAEIIAADFDMDGEVSAADAYDILQYAVAGHEPGGGTAKWVFIDELNSNEATASNVTFDHVIDQFVGQPDVINATGVLIGDVTSSYTGNDSPTMSMFIGYISGLVSNGLTTGVIETVETGAASGKYVVTATQGDDLIALGAATGYHTINDFDGVGDTILLDVDAYEIYDFGATYYEELSYNTSEGATVEETVAAALAIIDEKMGADNGEGGKYVGVNIDFADENSNIQDIYAFDTNGDGTVDLTVHVIGAYYDFMVNSADPDYQNMMTP